MRRQEVDLANLAQLSQYIVQHLRESILVVDTAGPHPAHQRIGRADAGRPQRLSRMRCWARPRRDCSICSRPGARRTATAARYPPRQTFVAADGARVIRAAFCAAGRRRPGAGAGVPRGHEPDRREGAAVEARRARPPERQHRARDPQSGRRHEPCRAAAGANPPQLADEDRRLTEIISNNADRVSGIINNVLHLSRREARAASSAVAAAWIEEFREEFCETMQLAGASGCAHQRRAGVHDLEVRADPTQLRQVVWNLCENALKYGVARRRCDSQVEIRYGRLSPQRPPVPGSRRPRPGRGARARRADLRAVLQRRHGGTGLGLFLARELAQTNGATLLYEPRAGGGSIFRLVFADPRRWEALMSERRRTRRRPAYGADRRR